MYTINGSPADESLSHATEEALRQAEAWFKKGIARTRTFEVRDSQGRLLRRYEANGTHVVQLYPRSYQN